MTCILSEDRKNSWQGISYQESCICHTTLFKLRKVPLTYSMEDLLLRKFFKTSSYLYVNSEFCNDFPLSTHKNYFQNFFGTLTSINPRQNSLLNWEKVALGKGLWLGHYFFADLSFCHLRPLAFGKKLIRAQSLPQKRP